MFDSSFTYDLSQLEEGIQERLDASLELLVDSAKSECPVDTGRMCNSITSDGDKIIVDTEYAGITEYRTGWFTRAMNKAMGGIKSLWQ